MTKKTLALPMAMAALLALPTTMLAQESKNGGLFGSQQTEQNEGGLFNQNGNREGEVDVTSEVELGGAEQENPTPMGSGIAILLAAGAGYVALKKKEDKQ